MDKRIIITESEKSRIMEMYGLMSEQTNYEKVLQKYVGKTILLYDDKNERTLHFDDPLEIMDVTFSEYDGIVFKGKSGCEWYLHPKCKYNPSEIDLELKLYCKIKLYDRTVDRGGAVYNKKLVDSLNKDAKDNNINWCKKPESDFGNVDKGDVSNLA